MRGCGGGSSPRLRGTLPHRIGAACHPRFIPAPAGNTVTAWDAARDAAVHPRACGEHPTAGYSSALAGGSSPRLRGTLPISIRSAFPNRFIPAPAGNTGRLNPTPAPSTVHPRACGEHGDGCLAPLWGDGSSPRLRGTRYRLAAGQDSGRFIPAPAGNTPPPPRSPSAPPVHPRACGEHGEVRLGRFVQVGSSPRLRGTPPSIPGICSVKRFIPAPAGNTY